MEGQQQSTKMQTNHHLMLLKILYKVDILLKEISHNHKATSAVPAALHQPKNL
jgi:hypothetical protein